MAAPFFSALALLSGVIGAGFASGREIVRFFSCHGGCAWAAVASAIAVLALFFLRLPAQMQRARCDSLPALCRVRFGVRLGALCGALFFLLSALTGGAMLAACAELAALSLNVHHAYALGLGVSLLLGFFCALRGLRGLALPGALLCALLPALLFSLLRLPAGETGHLPRAFALRAAADGALYGALNTAMLAGTLPLLLPMKSGARRRCVLLFLLLFCALLSLGVLMCLRHLSAVWEQPLPFVWLSRALGRRGYGLVAACLYAAALSTFCAMLSAMALTLPGARFASPLLRMALCAGLCLLAAHMGFGRIVHSAYPVLGLVCAALLLVLCLPFDLGASSCVKPSHAQSEKEAGR